MRSAVLLLVACAGCGAAAGDDASLVRTCGGPHLERSALLVESDRSDTSLVASLDGGCLSEPAGDPGLSGDVVMLEAHGHALALDRARGVVHDVVDDPRGARVVRSWSVLATGDDGSDPVGADLDAAGNLWVARFFGAAVVVHPDGRMDPIDLSDLDPDGAPDVAAVRVVGDRAWFAIGHLGAGSKPSGPGILVAVSTTPPYARAGRIDLEGSNPYAMTPFASDPNRFAVPCPGSHDAIGEHDGLEVVDLSGAGTHALVLREAEAGGSIGVSLVAADDEGYAIVEGAVPGVNPTSLVAFDPSNGEVTKTLVSTDAFYLSGVALDGDVVLVGDRSREAPAVRFYRRGTGESLGSVAPKRALPDSFAVP